MHMLIGMTAMAITFCGFILLFSLFIIIYYYFIDYLFIFIYFIYLLFISIINYIGGQSLSYYMMTIIMYTAN